MPARRSAEQIPVIVARDRTGATIDAVLPRLDAASITAALGQVITRRAQLCCDGGAAITAFARRARVKVHVLPATGAPMVMMRDNVQISSERARSRGPDRGPSVFRACARSAGWQKAVLPALLAS